MVLQGSYEQENTSNCRGCKSDYLVERLYKVLRKMIDYKLILQWLQDILAKHELQQVLDQHYLIRQTETQVIGRISRAMILMMAEAQVYVSIHLMYFQHILGSSHSSLAVQ